jgi:indole-3-glycerol phosphate synthase
MQTEAQATRKDVIPSILKRIVATKHEELKTLAGTGPELRHRAADARPARGFAAALRRPGEVRLLAEIKRRSPSAGEIRPGADPVEVARAYQQGGAAALSVLTDREYFGGDLDALRSVSAAVPLPVIRKDFVVDPLQVCTRRARRGRTRCC